MCADCYKSEPLTEEKLKEIADETWNAAQDEVRKELTDLCWFSLKWKEDAFR